MIKKWQNIQSRVNKKLKDAKKPGGGAPKDNPRLKQTPGGFHTTVEIPTNDAMVTEASEEQEKRESSSKKRKSRVPDEQPSRDLHLEVLI